jgi:hypothetical protein
MRVRMAAVVAAVGALTVSACSGGGSPHRAQRRPVPPPRYEIDATVLESGDHGPQLCAGPILQSRPPICGGVPVIGWDWSRAPGATSMSGVRWGAFHLVGTYDGERFTLTELPAPARPIASRANASVPRPNFSTPCPPPAGGWAITNPARLSNDDARAMDAAAHAAPDYAGTWVDMSITVPRHGDTPAEQLYDFGFTGDIERHRAELKALWGGPICVTRLPRTDAELRRIADELQLDPAFARSLGLRVLMALPLDTEGRVWVQALLADDARQRAVDRRYGRGVVQLSSALQPVSSS